MKTILHILNTGEYSGAENVAITIIKNYSCNCHGIYMSRQGNIANILADEKIEYYGVDQLSIHSIQQVVELTHPDIIHAHDYTASILASVGMKGIPVISHLHNNVPWMKTVSVRSLLYKLVLPKIKKVLAVSDAVVNECWYAERLRQKAVCIGNPIDLNRIRGKKRKNNLYELIFVGRLTAQKNPLEFLDIMSKLVADGENVSAVMLGHGELETECKQFIREHALNDNVTMAGFVDHPYDYMNEGAILVMPSLWEGFGLVAVEALAFGVPVVANPVGGLTDIVTQDCGYLAQAEEDKIAEIKRLLGDRDYYNRKSNAAKQRASEIENINTYMERLEKIYELMEVVNEERC